MSDAAKQKVDGPQEIAALLREWAGPDYGSTHWDGCEANHRGCAEVKAADAIERVISWCEMQSERGVVDATEVAHALRYGVKT